MFVDLIFMLVISLFVLHAYITTQNQFAATASAIRQIWSGGCPLSCRQSQYSRFSGLSSLPGSQTGPCRTMPPQAAQPGNSRQCACESCPCALIENFLSNCRPASNMYTQLVECSVNCIYYFVQMIIVACEYLKRVLQCQGTCQRLEAQNTDRHNPKDDFSFGKEREKVADKLTRLADKTNRIWSDEKLGLKEKNINLDNADEKKNTSAEKINIFSEVVESKTKEGTSKEIEKQLTSHPPLCKITSDSTLQSDKSKHSLAEEHKGVCAKCIKKGRVCVKDCPKAKKKK